MDISWLFGYAKISYYSSPNTITLPLKSTRDTTGSQNKSPVDFLSFVKSLVPPCRLSPLLPGGHLQTIYAALCKTDVPIHYRRRTFNSTHSKCPGNFDVDFVSHTPVNVPEATMHNDVQLHPRTLPFGEEEWSGFEKGSDDSRQMLVVLHGLSGGSHELYLRGTLAPILREGTKEDRWEACVVNARGCARSRSSTGVLFTARATWDLRQLVKWLREKYPNRPLFGLGFSIGANVLVNVGFEYTSVTRLLLFKP